MDEVVLAAVIHVTTVGLSLSPHLFLMVPPPVTSVTRYPLTPLFAFCPPLWNAFIWSVLCSQVHPWEDQLNPSDF